MYEHDGAGRLVASRPEPEWDDEQRAWMLALAAHRDTLCPLCGRPLSVCTDPATEGRWAAGPPTRCYPTTAIAVARKPYDEKSKQSEALLFSARVE